ncbi:T9SS type A sorting domain-containing protein [Flavobacterium terrisoli]|uniref:T9SS type A sorting domain-containing protein n=1 Tax=Flavobacterium terrisoli TaxID=3242195 RepID=UPI0025430FDA|nr:T9SS type A sorting domain-containing protein [Flavobacterium buctense]
MKTQLLLLLLPLSILGQTNTWTFPIPANSIHYSMGSSAPIVQTPDNGYILNYSYSYPNWDASPGYQSTIIKTDANFVSLWSKNLYGGNGKKTIVLNDGTSLFFTDTGSLLKLDPNGQILFSIGNFTTYPVRLAINDAELIGNNIKAVGTVSTYNGFGYVISSTQVIIDFDTNGNVLQTSVLEDGGVSAWTTPTNISKDNSGNYYITGYAYADGNYICKINSANMVLWSKRFKHINSGSIITINDILPLDTGDVLLAGNFYNYSISFGGLYLHRLSSAGNSLSVKTTSTYTSGINNITQLADGDIVATGSMREDDNAFNKTFSMRMSSNETFSWLKLYNDGFGISTPFVKSDNNWYYTAFHNNNFDNNNPILFNTENNGTTTCANDNMSLTFDNVTLNFNSINLTITPSSSLLETPSTLTLPDTEPQTYVEGCIPRLLGLNEFENKSHLMVYPNPSTGLVNIQSDSSITVVMVYNALGQKVNEYHCNSLETTIDIQNQGIYFLTIATINGIEKTKIIISK